MGRKTSQPSMPGDGPAARRPTTLARSLAYFVPSYALAILGYLALNVIAARVLGPGSFGYYAVLVSVTTLVGQFSLLGVHRSGLREAARADDAATLAQLRTGVRAVLRVPLPLASVLTGALLVLLTGLDREGLVLGLLTAVLVYESGYQIAATNFLRGLGQLRAASLLSGRSGGALVALSQTACVGFVAAVSPDSGLNGVMLGTVVGYAVPLVWAGWLLRRTWPVAAASGTLAALREVVRRDWKFTFTQSGSFLNSNVELWIVALVLPAEAASLFAAVQRIARLLIIPATSLAIVFSPAIARLAHQGETRKLERLVRTASFVTTASSGVVFLPIVLAPSLILESVFGATFSDGGVALVLLSTGYLLNAVSGMSGTTLSMAHREGRLAVITWCVVSSRVLAGSASALLAGVVGLATSSAVISVLFYAVTWLSAKRLLGVSTHLTLRPSFSVLRRVAG